MTDMVMAPVHPGEILAEVMQQSGARLVEVGTTNRVNLDDYRQALDPAGGAASAALVLHAHRSNFQLIGFVSEPGLAELAGRPCSRNQKAATSRASRNRRRSDLRPARRKARSRRAPCNARSAGRALDRIFPTGSSR